MTESGTALLTSIGGVSSANGGFSAPSGLISEPSKISHISSKSQSNPEINTVGEQNDSKTDTPNEITILYYGTFPKCTIKKEENEVWDFAHVCQVARDHLKEHITTESENGLLPVTLPLFGLIYKDHKHWLGPPMDKLLEGQNEFYFRFRFRPKDVAQLRIDSLALRYLFVQCHADFLNDRIKMIYDTEINIKRVLGFVTTYFKIPPHAYDYDEMQKKRQDPGSDNANSHRLKFFSMYKHLPKSYRKMFYLPWRYCKLYLSLKSDIDSSKIGTSVLNSLVAYVATIFSDVPKYCLETYSAVEVMSISNTDVELSVSFPISKACLQISAKGEKESLDIPIEDIVRLDLSRFQDEARIVISLSRMPPKIFTMKYVDGLAFLSLLDGFYKLSVNYHKHDLITKESFSYFNQMMSKNLGSFGPMQFTDCSEFLKLQSEKLTKRDIDFKMIFMIRQSIQDFDSYEVIKCDNNKNIVPVCRFTRRLKADDHSYMYSINGIERDFETEEDIVLFFKQKLDRHIKPTTDYSKCEYDVLIKRLFVNEIDSYYAEEASASQSVLHSRIPFLIKKQDVLIIGPETSKMDHFLSVSNVKLRTADEDKIVKMIQLTNHEELTVKITDDLMDIATRLQEFDSPAFIRFYGVLMSPLRLVVECPQYGDLQTLIKKMDSSINLCQIASALYTIVAGLQYLDAKNLIHGNLQCKNMQVHRVTTNSIYVKIGDPGLISFYNKHKINAVQNFNRIPWIAVELFDALHRGTIESEIYSLGTLMWEAMSFGKNPVSVLSIQIQNELISYFKNGSQLPPPPHFFNVEKGLDHNECCGIMIETMKDCWKLKPQERPSLCDLSQKFTSVKRVLSVADDQDIDIDQPVDNEARCISENSYYHGTKKISGDQLKMLEKLGDGHYGIVHKAKYTSMGTEMTVACKFLKPKDNIDAKEREMCKKMFEEEVELACKLEHPNIVKVIGYCPYYDRDGLALIMEFVEYGCLKIWLMKKEANGQKKDHKEFMRIGKEIAHGMAYLEEMKVIHRDLAARNVLLDNNLIPKITDFGLSKSLDPEKTYYKMKSTKRLPMYWSAPESLSKNKVSLKSDVWSYGIVLWEMFTEGEEPKMAYECKDYLPSLERGERLKLGTAWPDLIKQIILQCWELEPDNRPTFKQIIEKFQMNEEGSLNCTDV